MTVKAKVGDMLKRKDNANWKSNYTSGELYKVMDSTSMQSPFIINNNGDSVYIDNLDPLFWEVKQPDKRFTKHDDGKERFSLVPLEVISELTKVLEYGAKKYTPDNWKTCDDTDRYFNALMRHLFAQRSGESTDKESGMLHLSHAFCNLAFMLYFEVKNAKKSKTPID